MTTAESDDDLITFAFSLEKNPGAYAVLVGAGISKPVVPTAWEVLTQLIVDYAAVRGDGISTDVAEAWWIDSFETDASYENVLKTLGRTQIERQRLMRQFFEPDTDGQDDEQSDIAPTVAHKSIARLVKLGVVKVIVTMNFDHLLEKALRAEGIEPTIVTTESDVRGLAPLHTLDCCLIHLHGDYTYPETMLNTKSELQSYKPVVRKLLRQVIEEYGLIVSGWSAQYDPALREAISGHYPSRFTMLWMNPSESLSDEAEALVDLKDALRLRTTAEEGFGRLADAVESMRIRRARHPLTISTAAETGKRDLAGRWTAIRLHDTIRDEFERLYANPNFHLPSHQSADSYGGYEALVASTEEASKVPATLVAVTSYWGQENTVDWWIDEIERFAMHIRSGGGETRLIELRMIAGSALFYAAGVATVIGKRYDTLARLFALEREDPYHYGKRQPLRDVLAPPGAYENLPTPGRRHFDLVGQVLRESLQLGGDVLDNGWQTFEVLRLAISTQRMFLFDKQAIDFYHTDRKLTEALAVDISAKDVDPAQVGRQREELGNQRRELLGYLAQAVPLGPAHVMGTDRYTDHQWVCKIAERLSDDLLTDGDDHPFVSAGIGFPVRGFKTRAFSLSVALRAVSYAIGHRSNQEHWKYVGHGAMPDEIWLDTGKPAHAGLGSSN